MWKTSCIGEILWIWWVVLNLGGFVWEGTVRFDWDLSPLLCVEFKGWCSLRLWSKPRSRSMARSRELPVCARRCIYREFVLFRLLFLFYCGTVLFEPRRLAVIWLLKLGSVIPIRAGSMILWSLGIVFSSQCVDFLIVECGEELNAWMFHLWIVLGCCSWFLDFVYWEVRLLDRWCAGDRVQARSLSCQLCAVHLWCSVLWESERCCTGSTWSPIFLRNIWV